MIARARAPRGPVRLGAGGARAHLEVAEGEIVGLIGPNGAGKSTTLHAIMGLVPAHAARSGCAARRSAAARPRRSPAPGSRSSPRAGGSTPNLTVEENLRLGFAGRRAREGVRARTSTWVHELFPVVARVRAAAGRDALRRPAAAARDRARARRAAGRAAARRAVARPRAAARRHRLRRRCARSASAASRVLLVEQRAQRTVAFADRTYVLANGELVTTLEPEGRGRHRAADRAYLGASGLALAISRRTRSRS